MIRCPWRKVARSERHCTEWRVRSSHSSPRVRDHSSCLTVKRVASETFPGHEKRLVRYFVPLYIRECRQCFGMYIEATHTLVSKRDLCAVQCSNIFPDQSHLAETAVSLVCTTKRRKSHENAVSPLGFRHAGGKVNDWPDNDLHSRLEQRPLARIPSGFLRGDELDDLQLALYNSMRYATVHLYFRLAYRALFSRPTRFCCFHELLALTLYQQRA